MAKATRGTVLTIDNAYLAADNALRAVQSFFIANPSMSERTAKAAGHGDLFRTRNSLWRAATGSATTLVSCRCGRVNPHATTSLVTECCGSATVTVR